MTENQPESGALGRTLTAMSPSGKVLIDGVKYDARFRGGWADPDEEIVVVEVDAFGLIVDKPESQES